jgi:hypothetical protein
MNSAGGKDGNRRRRANTSEVPEDNRPKKKEKHEKKVRYPVYLRSRFCLYLQLIIMRRRSEGGPGGESTEGGIAAGATTEANSGDASRVDIPDYRRGHTR